MDYVHQMVDSDKLVNIFDLPHALRGRKVEVIILPVREMQKPDIRHGSAFGCLRKYADPSLISKERGAWEEAVVNKYANS